ncbi:MAG TPA: M23 family metallopeptidase [Thermoanaerobaculia bacterium]|nr:M23 family metallopeptidase [Thermoanaerobaculia bacterium]
MRSAVSFLIGCVLGATGVLMYVDESNKGLRAAERPLPAASVVAGGAAPESVAPPAVRDAGLLIPVAGLRAEDLRPDFNDRRGGGRTHQAIDIRAPRGTPVLAVADGTIRKLFTSKAGGLTIYHFDAAEEICYYYAHLQGYAAGVQEGMEVKRGDVIGYVGTSGNAPPNAPHLHFAVTRLPPTKEWWKGEAVDPYPLLTGAP